MRENKTKQQSVLIIGLGSFGRHLAEAMTKENVELILLDNHQEYINIFKDVKDCIAKEGDATNEEVLDELIADRHIEHAVVCIGENLTASILVSLLLRSKNVLNVYARANTPQHAAILRLIGVTEIIQPELETAQKWARMFINKGDLIISYQELGREYVMVEVAATTPLIYLTVEAINLRKKFSLNIVGIRSRVEELSDDFQPYFSEKLLIPPDPHYKFQEGDRLIVAGRAEHLQKFKDFLLGKRDL